MADASRTIDLIFNGIDRTSAATTAALRNLESFTTGVGNAAQPLADFTIGAAKLEGALVAAGAAVIAFSVKAASDFDTNFRQISTIVKASSGDLDGFKEAVLSYASGSTQPLQSITDALGAAIGSGVDWKNSIELIGVAERLAVGTRADLSSTTGVLVSTLNAYNLSTGDAKRVSDIFFQTIDDGNVTMDQLAAGFANVTAVGAPSGVSIEEIGAALATMTAAGIPASTALDSIKSIITNIIRPSEQAKDAAAALGIGFDGARLKSVGLSAVLGDVQRVASGNSTQMALLFGDVNAMAGAMTLTGTQADRLKETLAGMGNAAVAADAAVKIMSNSLGASASTIAGAFGVLAVRIGTPMLDEFSSVANAIANIFNTLGVSVKGGALRDLVAYVETQIGGLAAAFNTVATNLPAALASADFSGFTRGLDTLLAAIRSLFGGIDITTVEGLKAVIETTGLAFLGLSRYVSGAIESFRPMLDLMVQMGSNANSSNTEWLAMAGNLGGIATQAAVVAPLFTALFAGMIAINSAGTATAAAVAGVTAAIAGLGPVLAGGVLAGMAGIAGWGLGTAINDGILAPLLSLATGSETTLGGVIYDLVHAGDAARDMGVQAQAGMDAAQSAFRQSEVSAGNMATSVGTAQEEFRRIEQSASSIGAPLSAANQAMLDASAAANRASLSIDVYCASSVNLAGYTQRTVPIIDAATGALLGYEQKLTRAGAASTDLGTKTNAAGDSAQTAAAKIAAAEAATRHWTEEVARMDHAEKIRLIEQQTTISVARIEADTARMTAAFESVNTTITSTGALIGQLFGQLGNGDLTFTQIRAITDQIERENTLRTEAARLQRELTEATILEVQARTRAFASGDALISIDGAGLQPHLEAFMWEILRTIQTRVNADGLRLLVGA